MGKRIDRRPDRPHTQDDLENVVMDVLDSGTIMTTSQITKLVKERIELVPDDLVQANERPNESTIDQIIANTLNAKRGISKAGLIQRVGRGEFKITEAGISHNQKRREDAAISEKVFDEIFPNGID